MSAPDSPPAFPSPNDVRCGDAISNGHPGMNLRDWFAGQALAGLRSRDLEGAGENISALNMHHNHARVCYMDGTSARLARIAYQDADAMLKERAK